MSGNMRPFTSPKFPYEFGAKDNSISIDKKDYLLKESKPVELDEEGKLKKRYFRRRREIEDEKLRLFVSSYLKTRKHVIEP